jgi:hypothetical protein
MFRPLLDAALGGLLFVLIASMTTSNPVRACPFSAALAGVENATTPAAFAAVADAEPAPIIEIATTSSVYAPDAVYRRTSATAAWVLLGLAFSLLTALNLSFFRHLRRAYAIPRRPNARPK